VFHKRDSFWPCDHPLHHGFVKQVVGADDQRTHPEIIAAWGLGKRTPATKTTKFIHFGYSNMYRWELLTNGPKQITNISQSLPCLANAGSKSIRCCLGRQPTLAN